MAVSDNSPHPHDQPAQSVDHQDGILNSKNTASFTLSLARPQSYFTVVTSLSPSLEPPLVLTIPGDIHNHHHPSQPRGIPPISGTHYRMRSASRYGHDFRWSISASDGNGVHFRESDRDLLYTRAKIHAKHISVSKPTWRVWFELWCSLNL